jgi:hypothetical protein
MATGRTVSRRRSRVSERTFELSDGRVSPAIRKPWLVGTAALTSNKDVKTLSEVIRSKLKGEQVVDDKTMIMERVIQLVSNLPSGSRTRTELTNTFLNELWYSLDHPPLLYVGDRFKYRMADGSYNVRSTSHPPLKRLHVETCRIDASRCPEHPVPTAGSRRHAVRAVSPADRRAAGCPPGPGPNLRFGHATDQVQEAPEQCFEHPVVLGDHHHPRFV